LLFRQSAFAENIIMPLFFAFYGMLGLVLGSFLNVCIYRLPRGESIVFPGSHCPACGGMIKPYDNVPVLAYLWLKGRCRFCNHPISIRYPAVELLTGSAFCACALRWQFAPPTFVNSLLICILIVLVFIDYDHQILPNRITLPGLAAGILLSPLQSELFFHDRLTLNLISLLPGGDLVTTSPGASSAIASMVGAIIGGGGLFLVGWIYKVTRHRQGLGMGDIKMTAMLGAFFGWHLTLLTIFAGSFLGSIAGIFLIIFHGKTMQSKLAFGTFLGVGAVLALFFGIPAIDWYTGSY
jgi:leader peptidase (prepilin peptidase)/N-methyltransferase